MNILGIDPGSRNLGYAIIEKESQCVVEAGVMRFEVQTLSAQLVQMAEAIERLFASHAIDEVAIEDIFYAHNPKTVLKLAQFRGALALRILQLHGEFSEYTPLQVKRALTGNGKASKEQVAFMVKRILGIKAQIKPLDVSDAMAIALTHLQRLK